MKSHHQKDLVKQNAELKKELAARKRELEIESALEKVRVVALGMKRPEDMLIICKTISKQLAALGINEIRNIQTGIFYVQRGSYMNYQYYAKHDKTFITDTVYTDHKVAKRFVTKMLKGKGQLSVTHIKGKQKLKDWIAYQKGTNVFIDKYLYTASSLHYYWYSLGPVALGISTYKQLTKEEMGLFQRFLNVFELAYRRYLDIEKAEAQAYEARIEASLEKVRAQALGMYKPAELLNVCKVLFKELSILGFTQLRNAIIHSFNDEEGHFMDYDYSDFTGGAITRIPYNAYPMIKKFIRQIKSSDTAFVKFKITGKELAEWKKFRLKGGQRDDPRLNKASAIHMYVYSVGRASIGISAFDAIGEEKLQLLRRFRNVFDFAYRRYMDVAQAEAQAREVEIQLALEKVRARTMAMQKSEELPETTFLLFEQLKGLGETAAQLSIGIVKEQEGYVELSATVHGDKILRVLHVPVDEPFLMKKAVKAWKQQKKSLVVELKGAELKKYNKWRYGLLGNKIVYHEKQWVVNLICFSKGFLGFSADQPQSKETLQLLERFVGVFEQTYTRFLDLQKAEAQAREAQIETALERVRSRSMAMHKTDELLDAAEVIHKELSALGINSMNVSYAFVDKDEKTASYYSINPVDGKILPVPFVFPHTETKVMRSILSSWKKQQSFNVIELNEKDTLKHQTYIGEFIQQQLAKNKIPFSVGEFLKISPKKAVLSTFNFSKGYLFNIGEERLSKDEEDLMLRFTKVFEQTYTRFLDLQKAEAQAKEAQIQLALERVRAKSLAMHHTSELQDVVNIVSEQLHTMGMDISGGVIIAINDEVDKDIPLWASSGAADYIQKVLVPFFNKPIFTDLRDAIKKRNNFFVGEYSKEEKTEFFKHLFRHAPWNLSTPERKKQLFSREGGLTRSAFISRHTSIAVTSHYGKKFSDDENEILKRFGNVFEQSYIRFLDLQKAEGQAREAQIEASLERVRSRSIGMNKSEELLDVIMVVLAELQHLGIRLDSANFAYSVHKSEWVMWLASPGRSYPDRIQIPYIDHPFFNRPIEMRRKGFDFLADILTYEEKNSAIQHILQHTALKNMPEESKNYLLKSPGLARSVVFMEHIALTMSNLDAIPYTEAENQILRRFAIVFEQSYTRFLDLQNAERQAREAKIETALEKVRAKAMAMHKTEDLNGAVDIVFEELDKLELGVSRCGIGIMNKEKRTADVWVTSITDEGPSVQVSGDESFDIHPLLQGAFDAWLKQEDYSYILKGDDMVQYYKSLGGTNFHLPESQLILSPDSGPQKQYYYLSTFESGGLFAFRENSFPEEAKQVIRRFAGVFNLTYKRFLDLQKAEAQAREAQIEASLEKVRASAMAMHNSKDISATMSVIFAELHKLNIQSKRCGVAILSKNSVTGQVYASATSSDGEFHTLTRLCDMTEHPSLVKQYESWLTQENYTAVLSGEELRSYYRLPLFYSSASYVPPEQYEQEEYGYYIPFSEGLFYAWTEKPYSDSEVKILNRFKSIIDLTFRRFFDLQKAEAQAKEAKIEAALEKVRTRTMAMHKSSELSELVAVLYEKMNELGISSDGMNINIIKEGTQDFESWLAGPGISSAMCFHVPYFNHPVTDEIFAAFYAKKELLTRVYSYEEKVSFFNYLYSHSDFNLLSDERKSLVLNSKNWEVSIAFANNSALSLHSYSGKIFTEEENEILKRFARIFDQSYIRFMDLKKAEANAREAIIEASLERVRAKAMAMHGSEDLSATVNVFFKELKFLGIIPIRCGVGEVDEKMQTSTLSATTASNQGDSYEVIGKLKLVGHPILENIFRHWQLQKEYYPVLRGPDMKDYYNVMKPQVSFPDYPDDAIQYGSYFYFKEGLVFAWTEKELTEAEIKIFRRFTSIISLTYRRYMELQKSEANAREAVKQAALDRLRAEIASMRTITDLNRITPLIWNELTILGVPFIRCGVFIMDDSQKLMHTFLSTPEGKAIAAFHLPYDTPGNIAQIVKHWHDKENYIDHWDEEAFTEFVSTLVKQGALSSPEQYLSTLPHGGFYLHFLPFVQGMLYVGNTNQLNPEEINLIQSVADAFSTAYARYEDFNKLEAAKQQVDKTLVDLKQAQQQLIQSEKMASLGELTAGIAHEIQNPLNFVNNFSEVSHELLDEMKAELEEGNAEGAKTIATDVKQNLEKILHHGKRADAIVKGMLQHSRSGSGQKELTDINTLADEYLRLSFHGLRAKDKTFNAKFEISCDNSIGKINIIPQDIGRVILNLINNAFYAVTEKKKIMSNGYDPLVTVTTKKIADKIEIRVADNGNGIPQKVLDKIFQPFFTTKPTGQGTGLGLSLSYDIVTKGHGGELRVKTQEGEGSEFIIQLPGN